MRGRQCNSTTASRGERQETLSTQKKHRHTIRVDPEIQVKNPFLAADGLRNATKLAERKKERQQKEKKKKTEKRNEKKEKTLNLK